MAALTALAIALSRSTMDLLMSGLRQGLAADDIPISARLMAVADVYDAGSKVAGDSFIS